MKIALDYDGTITADKDFFKDLILLARKYGHKTTIVTMRHAELDPILDAEEFFYNYETPIIYCDGQPKRKVCEEQGVFIDVFMDDMPEGVGNGSSYTLDQLAQWREEQKTINANI